MKVSELVAILAECNPEAEVVFPDENPLVAVSSYDGFVALTDYLPEPTDEDWLRIQAHEWR